MLEKRTTATRMLGNFFWVITGHLIGCAVYAALYGLTITKMGTDMSNPLIQTLITASEGKTTAYKSMGAEGRMMLGADISFVDWWIWNGIPVLLGNFTDGLLFTGILLYLSQKSRKSGASATVVDLSPDLRIAVTSGTAALEKSL